MAKHPNHQQILDALTADPSALIEWAAQAMVALGAKSEWSNEDNGNTSSELTGLAGGYGLPGANDRDDDALRFYGEAAQSLGYPADLDDMDDEWEFTCTACHRPEAACSANPCPAVVADRQAV